MLVLGIMVDYQVEMILFKFPKILFFFQINWRKYNGFIYMVLEYLRF